ncbi:hypothetical protein [Ferruginibacter sp.]
MKSLKFLATIMLATTLAFTSPLQTHASVAPIEKTTDPEKDAKTLSEITARVTEIQNMDKSNLTASEKKALRKELMEMKKKADGLDSRVYLSVGALIIIILLLILILR